MICVRCERDKVVQARGLCSRCYRAISRDGNREKFPRTNGTPERTSKNPYIDFILKETAKQNMPVSKLAERAGYYSSTVHGLYRRGTIHLNMFTDLLEALGYEIMIVAKEPADVGDFTAEG